MKRRERHRPSAAATIGGDGTFNEGAPVRARRRRAGSEEEVVVLAEGEGNTGPNERRESHPTSSRGRKRNRGERSFGEWGFDRA